uniref:Uncharacterized protein n=1 Tax=Kuenenia stuttgartiensis TaxID=174633 RepID=Q1PZZ9_KUEST|nr:unknown protein [Candidatus Kuenenia stuttgartiensis]
MRRARAIYRDSYCQIIAVSPNIGGVDKRKGRLRAKFSDKGIVCPPCMT